MLITLFATLPWLSPFAPGPSPAIVPWLVTLAAIAGLILLTALRAKSAEADVLPAPQWTKHAALSWVLAGSVSSVIGLLQYFDMAAALAPWVNQSSLGEAFANLRQRNQFASLTNIALVALVWVVVTHRFDRCHQWLVWLVAGLLAAGNAASSSRTGLLQLVFLCVMCWLWGSWREPMGRRTLLTAALVYWVAALALPWVAGLDLMGHGMVARLRDGESVCGGRLTLWSNVVHLIWQKPWLGWGWGELDYAHYITLYPGARFCDILGNAHNLPLHLAVELGIPSALAICVGVAWLVWRARPWHETDPTRQMAWGVLAVIMLHSMLEYPLWYGPFQMAFGLCVWMLWPASRELAAGSPQHFRAGPVSRLVVGAALLAAIAYAAWDYHRVRQIYLAPQARALAYRDNTLDKIRGSWFFRNQVHFPELTTSALRRENAQWSSDTATALLNYSPEPRVIEKVIESAVMLGHDDKALFHLVRYRAAFPGEYEKWRPANGLAGGLAD